MVAVWVEAVRGERKLTAFLLEVGTWYEVPILFRV